MKTCPRTSLAFGTGALKQESQLADGSRFTKTEWSLWSPLECLDARGKPECCCEPYRCPLCSQCIIYACCRPQCANFGSHVPRLSTGSGCRCHCLKRIRKLMSLCKQADKLTKQDVAHRAQPASLPCAVEGSVYCLAL